MIANTIKEILKPYNYNIEDIIIANEGFAFSASGDAVLDLSGYKYILMKELIDMGFKKFLTYSPISIKATAECAKKGDRDKEKLITALSNQNVNLHKFIKILKSDNMYLRKRTAYVNCVDDLTDAFWCLKTVLRKEKIETILDD